MLLNPSVLASMDAKRPNRLPAVSGSGGGAGARVAQPPEIIVAAEPRGISTWSTKQVFDN